MPKWGLTEEMRRSEPYGLPADLLQPAKVITDPIHGDIRLTELERRVIDSPSFQRLRRIRQPDSIDASATRSTLLGELQEAASKLELGSTEVDAANHDAGDANGGRDLGTAGVDPPDDDHAQPRLM
jgi:hypothetical protein